MDEDKGPDHGGDIDAADLQAKVDAAADACCASGTCECTMDDEDLAILALGTGVASLIFGMFGWHNFHFLALPLGLCAMICGTKALKANTKRDRQAVQGVVCGVIGASFWVISLGLRAVHALFS